MKPREEDLGRDAPLKLMRLGLPLAVIALLAAAWQTGLLKAVSLSSIIMHHEMLASYVAENRLLALSLAAGFLFGAVTGALASIAGATAGAVIIFLIARGSLGGMLERRADSFLSRMAEGFRQDAFSYLLSLRLAPVFPFWVVNIVPAILNMPLRQYVLATFLGIIPGGFAFAFIGSGLGSVIEAQERAQPGCAAAGNCSIDPNSLVTPQLLWALAGLALLALVPVAAKRIAPRSSARPPAS